MFEGRLRDDLIIQQETSVNWLKYCIKNRHNHLKFLEIQTKVNVMSKFNKTLLHDLHKLDKDQLIKKYAEFRQYNFDKLTLIEQIIDILTQELGR